MSQRGERNAGYINRNGELKSPLWESLVTRARTGNESPDQTAPSGRFLGLY